ncbi:MAG: hypothetical protein OEY22_05345 [Candidatus Bathyarchaeota archaeon]|nr:hypothetical protein [Candidatus Bathyarchaeota archaeon]MDH5788501.1 hypothetical protein [Candidatus Bathyarchaeota archaeon]
MEPEFKASVVQLILDGHVEEALELLAKHYSVNLPKIKVGLPKHRKKNAIGCYTAKNETIYVLNSDLLKEPSIILHEFYHHLRTSIDKTNRGTEKYAAKFVKEYIQAYKSC